MLWTWCRPAAAALIGPLAWELPYAAGVVLKRKKERRKNNSKFWLNLLIDWAELDVSLVAVLFCFVFAFKGRTCSIWKFPG